MPKAGAASAPAASPPGAAKATHRMLALVAPGSRQAWFFKLVGETESIDAVTDAVKSFYQSVRMNDDGRPAWELPKGWTESPPAGMRLATITVADGLEMSVIGLPMTGDWDAQLLDNVNRWRRQMSLPPTGAPGLATSTTAIEGLDRAVLVELTGAFADGGMTPPFARGGAQRRSAPPRTPPPAKPPQEDSFTFTIPNGWVDAGATSMRKANLKTSEDAAAASVRAMSFAAFGQMGSPLANVNRWRGQVGLPPVEAEQVMDLAQPVKIGGDEAVLFEMTTDETATPVDEPMAMTAAMSKRGEQVWFFLMTGPPKTVAAERERFDEWLASVRFDKRPAPKYGGKPQASEEAADGDR